MLNTDKCQVENQDRESMSKDDERKWSTYTGRSG
jgi:hypothetical protein